MARPKSPPEKVRSQMFHVRLNAAEGAGLKQVAAALDQSPSRLLRRLIRETISAGPDYFDDGLLELRQMRRALDRVGGNLNQLVRALNQGGDVDAGDLRRVLNAVAVEVAAAATLYRDTILVVESRAVQLAETLEVIEQAREDAGG